MKTFKEIKEEIANMSAGIGVRGFGDVSGTPKVGDEEENNPHIDRVVQGAVENSSDVSQLIKNNTEGLYTWEGGIDWWADKKGMAKYTKYKSSEPLGFGKVKSSALKEEIGGVMGSSGGTNVGSGYIAGTGQPLEGKPSNWSEPGVSKKKQGKHKLLTRAKPNEVGSPMKEIPIQEVKKGMFAGEETFIVPTHVYERAMHAKRKGQHWKTYIKDETFHPSIREFAYTNLNSPIIFEDEKTGYMCYARYGKKRK